MAETILSDSKATTVLPLVVQEMIRSIIPVRHMVFSSVVLAMISCKDMKVVFPNISMVVLEMISYREEEAKTV